MREIKITTEPFEFVSLKRVDCVKELNEHGEIKIEGIIAQGNEEKYREAGNRETWVTVRLIDEENGERTFFCGLLTRMEITRESQVSILSVTVTTGSCLLDSVPHIRTYQTESTTYEKVIDQCLTPNGGEFLCLHGKNDSVDRFLIQYRETDWEFVKRLAGYAGTAVMPEYDTSGARLYFGYRQGMMEHIVTADSYRVIHNYGRYEERKAVDAGKATTEDIVEYQIGSRDVYALGETVVFHGMRLVVGKVESHLEGQELYHNYTFYSKGRGSLIPHDNMHIRGISLRASVTAVDKAVVKVKVHEDENKEHAGSKWFDYATVYSTPDGTGWYCMPEIGDEVRLVVPDNDESKAYVASNVHLESAGGRIDPNQKSWKNRAGKEILFTPDALIMRNNKGISIELSDAEGIKAISDKKIVLEAAGDVTLNSQSGGIQLDAVDMLTLRQGSASIQISDSINISGGKINMN